MAKYKCEDCNHVFEDDLSTMQCPSCGSANIKKVGSGSNSNKKWLAICLALLLLLLGMIGVVIGIGSGDKKLEASLDENQGIISIMVDGLSASTLNKEYNVVILDDQNNLHGEPFGFQLKNKTAQYSVMQLMEGRCYTFNIERKDGKPIKNLIWKSSHVYCVPIPAVKPEIDCIDFGVADHTALVWNHVKVIMKKQGNFTYTIGDKSQSYNEFNNVKPGSYIVVVTNEEGVSVTQPLILNDIKQLDPPLTLAQVQDIIDKMSSGSMSDSAAQDKQADGNVNLSSTIQPDVETLWSALMEAAMGDSFEFVYVRYNPKHGNASAIVRTIDNKMRNTNGQIVVFISHASSPIIATNESEWEEVRAGLLRMQTAYEYYAEDESRYLNSFFSKLFAESVDRNLHLMGQVDHSWVCTFIISETMLHSDEFESLAEMISVNELDRRMSVNVMTYNESQRLSLAEVASNTMFKFNISE